MHSETTTQLNMLCMAANELQPITETSYPLFGLTIYHGLAKGFDPSNLGPWDQHEYSFAGRKGKRPRLECAYGAEYRYGGGYYKGLIAPYDMEMLYKLGYYLTGETYTAAFCNLYRDGQDCVGWHNDIDKALNHTLPIVSFSFGAARKFKLKTSAGEALTLILQDGDVVIMTRQSQYNTKHCLPRMAGVTTPRINVTLRG